MQVKDNRDGTFTAAVVPRRLIGALAALVCVLVWSLVSAAMAQAASPKIVVIVEENKSYSAIVSSRSAPYFNSLIASGKLFTNYSAITGGSLHDYLAMTSGLTTDQSPPAANVFRAIDASGGRVSWTSFEESMVKNCGVGSKAVVPGTSVRLYSKGHDPAWHYRLNESCAQHDVPMTTATFNPANLPDFSYVVPNQCNNMHTYPGSGASCPAFFGTNSGANATLMGDNWLRAVVPTLLQQPNVTVFVTFDESGAGSQRVATVMVGSGVVPGSTDTRAYNHYGLLAGLYAKLGLGTAPNNGATATPVPLP
jgi:acid phosphatase